MRMMTGAGVPYGEYKLRPKTVTHTANPCPSGTAVPRQVLTVYVENNLLLVSSQSCRFSVV